jgi:alginate O-acetyltransferase complex protein AlgI
MSFTSIEFLIFTIATVSLYALVPQRFRWIPLLLASIAFYATLQAPYLMIALAVASLSSYIFGRLIGKAEGERRKRLLIAGIGMNLLVLIGFRYLSDLIQLLTQPAAPGIAPTIFIAVGVSFFAFQGISYLADIYLDLIDPEDHLGRFCLYMAFFPKILQGPIERGGDLLPQLKDGLCFNESSAVKGLRRIAWGLFKKFVIANRLALFVDPVFTNVHNFTGFSLILAVYLYAFQLYFDFSGYTDIAIGLANLFNIRLSENFNQPYLARSISDFWRRWHMSFSRWILDYIFRPLQISWRSWGTRGIVAALIIAFAASGLWHGASWGFLVWGLLFGIYMAIEVVFTPWRKKFNRRFHWDRSRLAAFGQVFLTFNLVSFAWIFFRANSFSDALYAVTHLTTGNQVVACMKLVVKQGVYLPVFKGVTDFASLQSQFSQTCLSSLKNFPTFPAGFGRENMWILAISLVLLVTSSLLGKRFPVGQWPTVFRWAGYIGFSLWILCAIWILETPGSTYSEFLYFRF